MIRQLLFQASRQRTLVISVGTVFVLISLLLVSHSHGPLIIDRVYTRVYSEYSSPLPAVEDFSQLVSALWKPYRHPLDSLNYTTDSGKYYEIANGSQLWQKPLGKDVLILDVDTRVDNKARALGPTIFNKENMTPRAAGMLNHYIYAQIHGYDYKFIKAPIYPHRHQTWVKVPMIREELKTHKFVVFLDADAIFVQPQLPIEFLLGLWNITDGTLVAMAEDPNSPVNRDEKGWVLWNTGFVVAQQSQRTQEMFKVWDECPMGERFPGCEKWAKEWAHEQAAFGNYIRYAYNTTDDLRVIPCGDGNGAAYLGDKKCLGAFVSHFWGHKGVTIEYLHKMVAQGLMRNTEDNHHDAVFNAFIHPLQGKMDKQLKDILADLSDSET
ncbi:Galactomannan galactosyltransferase 1 like protein [Verticillium longisporum]|nr:Galactomannan galactosyltransferase 1 like protein [Verticillium longisporum]